MGVGAFIRLLREHANLSLGELARTAHVSKGYLSLLENEKNTKPSIAICQRIADALGVPLASIVEPDAHNQARRLVAHAKRRGWSTAEVRMMSALVVDGNRVESEGEWDAAYDAIIESVRLERGGSKPKGGDTSA